MYVVCICNSRLVEGCLLTRSSWYSRFWQDCTNANNNI